MKRNSIQLALVLIIGIGAAIPAIANGSSEQLDAVLESGDYTVWSGDTIQFTKPDGADPTVEENQDRITDSVWITRRNDGGQIFNIAVQERPSKPTSPKGTLWAVGTTDNLNELTFQPFRDAVNPKDVAGQDLVMFIEEERVFLDVRFLSWSQEKKGGFSYERTTP